MAHYQLYNRHTALSQPPPYPTLFRSNNDWTRHTYEVLLDAEQILVSLVDIETGLRGYLLTGRDEFLTPLREGEKTFQAAFESAKRRTSDNAQQQGRLNELQRT